MVDMRGLLPLIVNNALTALDAVVILLIGLWLSSRADLLVVRMLSPASHFDAMLKSFLGSPARYLVLTVTAPTALSQFGFRRRASSPCSAARNPRLSRLLIEQEVIDREDQNVATFNVQAVAWHLWASRIAGGGARCTYGFGSKHE
jgi:hypothetical protein